MKPEMMVMAQRVERVVSEVLQFRLDFAALLAASVTGQLEPVATEPPASPSPRTWVFKPGELQRCILDAYEASSPLTFGQVFAAVQQAYPLASRGSVQSRHAKLVQAGTIGHVPGQPRLYQRAAQRPQLSILP